MSLTPEGVERLPTFGNVSFVTSLEWAFAVPSTLNRFSLPTGRPSRDDTDDGCDVRRVHRGPRRATPVTLRGWFPRIGAAPRERGTTPAQGRYSWRFGRDALLRDLS
jgi:hypothetical protein